MSELFTDTITLYNHYKRDGDDAWNRTVLKGVRWTEKKEKTVSQNGVLAIADYISITVPGREGYIAPKEYAGTDFTFGLGNLDFVVYGDVTDEIVTAKDLAALKKAHDVYTVSSVSDNTQRKHLKHWRVIAK